MSHEGRDSLLHKIRPDQTVLIAGPTASGKSALALRIAEAQGGLVVNADASQVYDCWRIISARPSPEEEARVPHRLYGHVSDRSPYSTGHWLRDVAGLMAGPDRLIIVGGTGLYFKALTEGLAEIPQTPSELRREGDGMTLDALVAGLDEQTRATLDLSNRARVQRAWEVLRATGRSMVSWQAETGAPLIPPVQCMRIALDVQRAWLNDRIERRFDAMLQNGALDEVAAVRPRYDPTLPAHRAIGVPELMAYLTAEITLAQAREATIIATRQFAKRQRTWQRNKMADWLKVQPE